MNYEIIGIIGTLVILVGFLSNSEKSIRIFDMIGSALFVIYGVLIHSFSNVFLNSALILVHVVKLYKMYSPKKKFF